jgi:hypothetical protein
MRDPGQHRGGNKFPAGIRDRAAVKALTAAAGRADDGKDRANCSQRAARLSRALRRQRR